MRKPKPKPMFWLHPVNRGEFGRLLPSGFLMSAEAAARCLLSEGLLTPQEHWQWLAWWMTRPVPPPIPPRHPLDRLLAMVFMRQVQPLNQKMFPI